MNVISTDFYKSNVWMIYYDFWPKMVVYVEDLLKSKRSFGLLALPIDGIELFI